jgi:hypothetical protein
MSSTITVPFTGTITGGTMTYTPPPGSGTPPPGGGTPPPTGSDGIPDAMPVIPFGALTTGILDAYDDQPWKSTHDADSEGGTKSEGTTTYINAVEGRNFKVTYEGKYSGHRFSLWCADDADSLNWCYDLEVRFAKPDEIRNMELDINQVLDDGRTVIYDCQCVPNGWEVDCWKETRAKGNPQQWGTGWHHVRIFCSRSADGNVTNWIGVEFDGAWRNFNYPPGNRALELGWDEKRIVINFQLGSAKDSGVMEAWARNIQVWRW